MLKDIVIAIRSYGAAHKFIRMHNMWRWIVIPGILYLLLFVAGMYLFWTSVNGVIGWLHDITGLRAWLDRINSGFLHFLFSFAEVVLSLVMLLFYFSIFKYAWLIVGSPVFAYLSEKTESIIEGREFPFSTGQLLKDMIRGIAIALRNLGWQSVFLVAVFLLSLVPIAGWVAPLIALLIECYYYGFSMIDYSCERHKLPASQSIFFISRHKGLAIGNGLVFYAIHLLPIIGWILAPAYSVIAATLSLYHYRSDKDEKTGHLFHVSPSVINAS